MTPEDKTLLLVEDDRPLRAERRPSEAPGALRAPNRLLGASRPDRATIKKQASAA